MNNNMTDRQNKELKKNWAAACHASALLGLLIPFGQILGPLIVWLINKERYEEVMTEGKLAINFQITATLALVLMALALSVVVISAPAFAVFVTLGLGAISWLPIILAGIKAYKIFHSENVDYPFVFRFVR